jgi:hypothetical protein
MASGSMGSNPEILILLISQYHKCCITKHYIPERTGKLFQYFIERGRQ